MTFMGAVRNIINTPVGCDRDGIVAKTPKPTIGCDTDGIAAKTPKPTIGCDTDGIAGKLKTDINTLLPMLTATRASHFDIPTMPAPQPMTWAVPPMTVPGIPGGIMM